MTDIPVVMTPQGAQPTAPATLLTQLLALVAATNPGYTANLPGSLIEDISSTDVGALSIIDSARVETINSLTPFGANEFLLNQLGQIYGVVQGLATNTSVYCVFSGTVGFVVPIGFTVSDGSHQYVVQDGGVIASGGSSAPLFCLATVAGTWSVPANTVTSLVTSVPGSVTLTVTNPNAGTPGTDSAETESSYRSRVLQAGQAVAQGMPAFLKTQITNVSGVQARLVSIKPAATSGFWEVIVGGGDPYQIAYAIFTGLFDVTTLAGSTVDPSRNVTVSVLNYPDSYPITFVNPVQQTVAMTLTWGTIATNSVSGSAVAQLGAAALSAYVNSIVVGQPINLFELQATFQQAIVSLVPTSLLTKMEFIVSIDSVVTPPEPDTGIIAGDPEGYFTTEIGLIFITQG